MAYDNNRTSIIKSWKDRWNKSKANYWLKCILSAGEDLPDHWSSNYVGLYEKGENTEEKLAEDRLSNNFPA